MSFGLQITIIVLLCVIMAKGSDLKDDKKENDNNQPLVSLKGGVRKSSEYFHQLFISSKEIEELLENNQTLPEPDTYTEKEEKMKRKHRWSQYHGISHDKRCGKWIINNNIFTKKQKEMLKDKYNSPKFGTFHNEKDAAMKLNDICKKMGIDLKNPGIGINTTEKFFKRKSKYKNVYMHHPEPRWYARMTVKGITYDLGRFEDENKAGRAVNKKCIELKMEPKNPEHLFSKNSTHEKNVEENKTKSSFQCVTLNKTNKIRWKAGIYNMKIDLGYFDTEIEAARALNKKYIEYNLDQDPEFLRDENVTMNTDEDETDGSSTKRKRKD